VNYEDSWGALECKDIEKAFSTIFSGQSIRWLKAFHTTFCAEGGNKLHGILHRLDEFFIAPHGARFDLTHDHVQRLLHFAERIEDGSIRSFDEARQSIHWTEYLGRNAVIDMTELLLRFNGSYVFETISGNVGFCCRPISPGDRILLVPGGGCLHAISADCTHYVGEAHVQGWTEESILQLRPEVERRLEMFCVS
jgi:hypothetical protein